MMNARTLAMTSLLSVGIAGCTGMQTSEQLTESDVPWESDTEVSPRTQLDRATECRTRSLELTRTVCAEADEPLVTDTCDDDSYADVEWDSFESDHFVLYTLPGTAANIEVESIAAVREAAYDDIRASLGLDEEPIIEVYLSPNRTAAGAHGVSTGRAYPWASRYEVIYTGHRDGYESVRYGHELTHVLAYRLDPSHWMHLGVLSEGLAELLDQSGRNLHAAYADNLVAGMETRTRLTRFEDSDVWGNNYGRAGSLVQFLVERYGMATFLEIYELAFMDWIGDCYGNPDFGCVESGQDVTGFIDAVLEQATGDRWEQIEPDWRASVAAALRSERDGVSDADREQIAALFQRMDAAMTANDADAYRATMEGFYCDWGGEDGRMAIAQRAVEAYRSAESTLVNVISVGVKNFPVARATVLRKQGTGPLEALTFDLERLPEGWRVTWGPDWH